VNGAEEAGPNGTGEGEHVYGKRREGKSLLEGVSLKGFWLLKERGILYEHGKGK
jgi:hypothetical protein